MSVPAAGTRLERTRLESAGGYEPDVKMRRDCCHTRRHPASSENARVAAPSTSGVGEPRRRTCLAFVLTFLYFRSRFSLLGQHSSPLPAVTCQSPVRHNTRHPAKHLTPSRSVLPSRPAKHLKPRASILSSPLLFMPSLPCFCPPPGGHISIGKLLPWNNRPHGLELTHNCSPVMNAPRCDTQPQGGHETVFTFSRGTAGVRCLHVPHVDKW
jgi:hypothetical protein